MRVTSFSPNATRARRTAGAAGRAAVGERSRGLRRIQRLARPGFTGLLVSPDAGRNAYVIHRPYAPRGDETLDGAANRAEMATVFEAKVSRLYECLGIEIGYRYAGSPVVVADTDPAPPCDSRNYLPTSWAGARLPSAFRDDGTAVFDLLDARGFTLGRERMFLNLPAAVEACEKTRA